MRKLRRLLFTVYGLQYTVHRTQYTLLLSVYFFISTVALATAAPNYERSVDQLSQAITTYKDLTQHPEKYDVAFRRDPMKPLVDAQGNILATSGMKDGLSVQGVIWSEEHPLVVIDGDLYAEGDTIDQYTIAEIRKDGVAVQNGTATQFIPIDRGIESTPSDTP